MRCFFPEGQRRNRKRGRRKERVNNEEKGESGRGKEGDGWMRGEEEWEMGTKD